MKKIAHLVILLSASIQLSAMFNGATPWTSNEKRVQTIFYQGIMGSQTRAANYTGSRGFIGTTGEHIVNPSGIDVIQNAFVKPEIDEVTPARLNKKTNFSYSPKSVLMGLYTSAMNAGHRLINRYYGIQVKNPTDQPFDHTIAGHSVDLSKVNIGQDGDIKNFIKRYNTCNQDFKNSPINAYGISRGAATTGPQRNLFT